MEKKQVLSDRGVCYYWIYRNPSISQQKWIFFCHGLMADHTLFEKQFDFWSKNYNLIAWDMPLHGESKIYYKFTLENAALEIKAILDAENIEKCILMGQSVGGYVCQVFASKYPEHTEAFIGIGATSLDKSYYTITDLWAMRLFPLFAKRYPYGLFCRKSVNDVAYTPHGQSHFYKSLLQLGRYSTKQAVKSVFAAIMYTLKRQHFPLPDIPILLVVGEYDRLGFVKRQNIQWAKRAKLPLLILKNAGHNTNYDNFDEFNAKVGEYFNELPRN